MGYNTASASKELRPMKVILKAKSAKGKSRIGRGEVDALVEQRNELPNGNASLFVIISFNHCRWVRLKDDPDFEVREVPEAC